MDFEKPSLAKTNLKPTMAKVRWLLEQKPTTRGDYRVLEMEFRKYFEHIFYYDPDTKRLKLTNPEGITYDDLRLMVASETIDRAYRKIIERDIEYNHDSVTGEPKANHICLLPTDKTTFKRAMREGDIRKEVVKL